MRQKGSTRFALGLLLFSGDFCFVSGGRLPQRREKSKGVAYRATDFLGGCAAASRFALLPAKDVGILTMTLSVIVNSRLRTNLLTSPHVDALERQKTYCPSKGYKVRPLKR